MAKNSEVQETAHALHSSIGLLLRRLRQSKAEGDLTLPETAVLSRLDRGGPATTSALAKIEGITPQSMGATIASLEARGIVRRGPDPADGRRWVISITRAGARVVRNRRTARTEQFARALAKSFTRAEIQQLRTTAPLLERLAEHI